MKVSKVMYRLALIAVLFSIHQIAFALDGLRLVQGQAGPSFTLHYQGAANQKLDIRISDAFDQPVFNETIKTTGSLAKKYNLRNLPEGQYTVEVSDETRINIQPIYVFENAVQIDTKAQNIIYKPQIRYHDQLLDINMLSNHEAVDIQVRDANGLVLFNNSYSNKQSIHKRCNLSQLRRGSYLLVIKNGEQTYYKEFNR